MEFKKCSRCGNFFISNDDVCPKCKTKDTLEFETFKSYIAENGLNNNLDTLSNETGISVKNINRYLNYNDLNNGNNIKL
jgi:hypothetical protein